MEQIIKEHERLATIEQDLKSVHRRLDNLEKLTNSVYNIANELKATREKVDDLTDKVDEIEKKPVERYNKIATTVIAAIVTAAVSFFAGLFFKK